MTSSAITSDIDAFVSDQNQRRGGSLAGGGTLPLDYDALTGVVPAGGNAVSGIAGIASGAATIALPSGSNGNAVIIDGAISTAASTSGADNYSFAVDTSGTATLTDLNTGNAQVATGASYFVFDGAAKSGAAAYESIYLVESGANASMAAMFNAAFERVPDLPGLEFYIDQYGTVALPSLHAMAQDLIDSNEFKVLYPALQMPSDDGGANDQAFISQLYGQILHRTPNASEIQFYVNALQGLLSDSNGNSIAPADRADLLQYFTGSQENKNDISAANGGWLINPADRAVSLGAMSNAAASAVLASDVASGTVNASDFANMASDGRAGTGTVTVYGADYTIPGTTQKTAFPEISTTQSNLTINLSAQYYAAQMGAAGLTINGVPTGDSTVLTPSWQPGGTIFNDGGVVNLFAKDNVIYIGSAANGGVTVPTVVNGWNSSDIITQQGASETAGTVLQGSSASPVSGASLAAEDHNQGFQPAFNVFAINVGPISDDSASTMVSAANKAYKVADASAENAFFFGQDAHGNTMVFWWRGDTTHSGSVLISDISGAVELVGVLANSITGANFHS